MNRIFRKEYRTSETEGYLKVCLLGITVEIIWTPRRDS